MGFSIGQEGLDSAMDTLCSVSVSSRGLICVGGGRLVWTLVVNHMQAYSYMSPLVLRRRHRTHMNYEPRHHDTGSASPEKGVSVLFYFLHMWPVITKYYVQSSLLLINPINSPSIVRGTESSLSPPKASWPGAAVIIMQSDQSCAKQKPLITSTEIHCGICNPLAHALSPWVRSRFAFHRRWLDQPAIPGM